ncbi:WGR domain-containing protein [Vibrio crassostreae]|uniref:WGR domain-containing protein n=1 Tax=Vibrio crassostreae TaxID=246167 RepID=UPI001B314502
MLYYFTKLTRYYALELKKDLFDIVVVKHYGRINTRLGQTRTHAFDSQDEAKAFLTSECQRRLKRGYILCDAVTCDK